MLILEPVENRERSELGDPSPKNPQISVVYGLETKNARRSISRRRALSLLVAKVRTLTKAPSGGLEPPTRGLIRVRRGKP